MLRFTTSYRCSRQKFPATYRVYLGLVVPGYSEMQRKCLIQRLKGNFRNRRNDISIPRARLSSLLARLIAGRVARLSEGDERAAENFTDTRVRQHNRKVSLEDKGSAPSGVVPGRWQPFRGNNRERYPGEAFEPLCIRTNGNDGAVHTNDVYYSSSEC